MKIIPERVRRRLVPQFPKDPKRLEQSPLFNTWWYYGVELLPGLRAKGHYPDDMPMLPRIVLRNCDLRDTTCLDIGTMEGLIPALMSRGGAKHVLAVDAVDHCHEKMAAIRHYYKTPFEFQQVGLMYDLTAKLRRRGATGFDVINLSGLLYHVFSPLMVLAGVRPLLRKNGLMIVSTNVVADESVTMHFNNAGRLQEEPNTFWYLSVKALDYILRYLKLAPIDCVYLPHDAIRARTRYLTDVESGYCSVVCRAQDDILPTKDDAWMRRSAQHSWEHQGLVDWSLCDRQPRANVPYSVTKDKALARDDVEAIDLFKAVQTNVIHKADRLADTHTLMLADRS